ncbi:sensor histidine kinase [Agromyces sp. MMS24-JH15]|uniref:sensor histidine kinase n=1 Tax=Agromyces sp. MMS24-JH15 TaxID=3243765 RepID=UPI0037491E4F
MAGSGDAQAARLVTTIDRSVVLQELLFGLAMVVAAFSMLVLVPETVALPVYTAGFALGSATIIATILVPWSRVPKMLIIVVPLLNIVSVGLLRATDPFASALGMLWIFPVIWLSTYFGVLGAFVGLGTCVAFVLGQQWLGWMQSGEQVALPSVMLPIALTFVAVSSVLASRRTSSQRTLVRAQARQLERSLEYTRRQEAALTELLDSVEFGVVRIDRDGRRVVVNEAYARMYGLNRRSIGESVESAAFAADLRTLIQPEDRPFARAMRGEEFDDVVIWVPDPVGNLAAISVTARAIIAADGGADGSVVVARDVTAELAAVRARDDLIASVSHELRTPMTSIMGYVELSADEPGLPERVGRNLAVIERNGQRMLELIASILEGARHNDQRAPLELADVDLGTVVQESAESLRPRADDQGLVLDLSRSAEHVVVRGDAFRLRQVVDNLLSNAIKYNRPGGTVAMSVAADGPLARVAVQDSGLGIPAAEMPRLFDRFFRSSTVQKGAIHGSGLGLAIAKDLVEAHGGRLLAESEEGVGTTMTIELPVAGPEAA